VRWRLWTACGTHQPDSLPRTETGRAKRPRYSARCASQWTSAEPLLDFPPAIRVRARSTTRFKSSSAISHQ
jgi:hypothetical protein